MSDAFAEVLPVGKLRLVPGVNYRVIAEFTDDSNAAHLVGESWKYLGFEQPKMYPGYVIHGLHRDGSELSFRLRWGTGGQLDVAQSLEKYVTGPVVPTNVLVGMLSQEGVAAFERVKHWLGPLPQESNAFMDLVRIKRLAAGVVALKDGPQEPEIDFVKIMNELDIALRDFDA